MTLLVTDPKRLPLVRNLERIRIRLIGQVCSYDHIEGSLILRRASIFRPDSIEDCTTESIVSVNVASIADQLDPEAISEGYIVDLGLFYDNMSAAAFEYRPVNAQCLAELGAAHTLSSIPDLEPL